MILILTVLQSSFMQDLEAAKNEPPERWLKAAGILLTVIIVYKIIQAFVRIAFDPDR